MSYQKCPICRGTGMNGLPGTFNSIDSCKICEGHGIINELTGRPPKSTKQIK